MNKKGFIGVIMFFLILFSILIIAFISVISLGIVDFASDTVTPIMNDLGVIKVNDGNINMSEASEYTFGTVNTIVQAMPWVLGFSFVAALIFSIFFAIFYAYNPHPAFMGIYIIFSILLIFGSIVMSNMYQDIYNGDDEIAVRLQEQTLSSYMILHSPIIFALISIITGIYLFTRPPEVI